MRHSARQGKLPWQWCKRENKCVTRTVHKRSRQRTAHAGDADERYRCVVVKSDYRPRQALEKKPCALQLLKPSLDTRCDAPPTARSRVALYSGHRHRRSARERRGLRELQLVKQRRTKDAPLPRRGTAKGLEGALLLGREQRAHGGRHNVRAHNGEPLGDARGKQRNKQTHEAPAHAFISGKRCEAAPRRHKPRFQCK